LEHGFRAFRAQSALTKQTLQNSEAEARPEVAAQLFPNLPVAAQLQADVDGTLSRTD